MARLSLTLLGSPEVALDGDPVSSFQSNKVRALLVYLAVEADRPHRRDALATLLWPDRPDRTARGNLRKALSHLRKAIGDRPPSGDHKAHPPFLLITRETIQFNSASDCWIDVAAFSSLVEPHPSRNPSLEQLEEAVALYRGPFLEGFSLRDSAPFDDWCVLTQERLHRQAMVALQRLAGQYERQGELEQACEITRRQVDLEPWQEEAHRELMRLLALSGQRSAALVQYEACRRTLMDQLGVEPIRETRALYERIRDGPELPSLSRGPPHNLPLPQPPLIGREAELAQIQARLEDPACRLLTVIGPGGIGKSRLALQAAADQLERFPQGVYLVNLAPIGSPELLAYAIMEALDVPLHGSAHPHTQLLNLLHERTLLLVLDNFEHLLAATPLITQMLRSIPGLKLLVTSRERLNLREEWLLPLRGLRFPDDEEIIDAKVDGMAGTEASGSMLEHYGAIQLLVQCAQRVHPPFSLDKAGPSWVARICQLVEGMPLAIELATPWMRVMPCRDIALEIERNLGFLSSSLRDMPERHRSMAAVFDHSWSLLTTDEQEVLSTLAVFRGGFRREAAEAVAVRLSQSPASLARLSSLVDKSWLRTTPSGRYEMHELVRQYAAEHLEMVQEVGEQARDRHSTYYAIFLQEREPRLKGSEQPEALSEIVEDRDNIRAAWDWAVQRGDVWALGSAMEALWFASELRGWSHETERALERAALMVREKLALADPALTSSSFAHQALILAQILRCQAWHCWRLGSPEWALSLCEESLALTSGVPRTPLALSVSAQAGDTLGLVLPGLGRCSEAHEVLQEALSCALQAGDRWWEAAVLEAMALNAQHVGRYPEAQRYAEGAIASGLGDCWLRSMCLFTLGELLCSQAEYQRAGQMADECLRLSEKLGSRTGSMHALRVVADVAAAMGDYAAARTSYERSLDIAREASIRYAELYCLVDMSHIALRQGDISEAVWLCSEAAAISEEMGAPRQSAMALTALGMAKCAAEDYGQAGSCFQRALSLLVGTDLLPEKLNALAGVAALLAAEGELEQATELSALALHHPGCDQVVKERAQDLLAELESELPRDAFTAAIARGQARELDDAIGEVLGAW